MKMITLFAVAMLAAGAQSAVAAPPGADAREGALMLYFTKSFGDSDRHPGQPLAFGLRFDQVSLYEPAAHVSMFDARLSLSGRRTLTGFGMPMFDSSLQDRRWFASFGSATGGLSPGMTAFLFIGGGAAVACATHLGGFCEGSDDEDTSDTNTPG